MNPRETPSQGPNRNSSKEIFEQRRIAALESAKPLLEFLHSDLVTPEARQRVEDALKHLKEKGFRQDETGESDKKEDKEKPIELEVKLYDASGFSISVGQATVIKEDKARLIIQALHIKGAIPKEEILRIAKVFGLNNEVEKQLTKANVWAGQLELVLNCDFPYNTGPRILSTTQGGQLAPLEFSDRMFGDWRPGAHWSTVKINSSARPPIITIEK